MPHIYRPKMHRVRSLLLRQLVRRPAVRTFISTAFSPAVAEKPTEPLRILFCGSDKFSVVSLEALHQEHLRNPNLIESIDVLVRPGKRFGRGMKMVREGQKLQPLSVENKACRALEDTLLNRPCSPGEDVCSKLGPRCSRGRFFQKVI